MRNLSKVLVVDDSTSACLFMAQALEKVGYQVITAASGYEGLTKIVQESPQCLILDVVLPGVNGFEVCRRLRAMEFKHRLSIILVSTKNTLLDRNWGLRQGADRYLPKPFTEEALVQMVEDVLPESARPSVPAKQQVENRPSFARQQPQRDQRKVIPYRIENHLLTANNPLDNSVVILDRQARRLYTAIDGHRNVEELCAMMHCGMEEFYRALDILLAQHRIELHRLQESLPHNSPFSN